MDFKVMFLGLCEGFEILVAVFSVTSCFYMLNVL
uniref:Uncharacterized protein n=1 Tax=Rhizophora mucronata TaxID=61149 RepID=A0A2P2NCK4_RHIMU